MLDAATFREVMSAFPSGVVVVTAFGHDGAPRGLTVSAFCPVSLDPPLVLVCIDRTSNTLPALEHSRGFTVNILATGREQLARRMASKLPDKFEGIHWSRPEHPAGGPVLEHDVAAHAVCRLTEKFEAGDHLVFIGEVLAGAHVEGRPAMVYSRRGYHQL